MEGFLHCQVQKTRDLYPRWTHFLYSKCRKTTLHMLVWVCEQRKMRWNMSVQEHEGRETGRLHTRILSLVACLQHKMKEVSSSSNMTACVLISVNLPCQRRTQNQKTSPPVHGTLVFTKHYYLIYCLLAAHFMHYKGRLKDVKWGGPGHLLSGNLTLSSVLSSHTGWGDRG